MGMTCVKSKVHRLMPKVMGLALGVSLLAARADGQTNFESVAGEVNPSAKHGGSESTNTVADQFKKIRDEYEAARQRAERVSQEATSEFEAWKAYKERMPDEASFSKRIVDLAATDPKGPAARDGLLWVLDKPGMGPGGPYNDEFARAVLLLLRHHVDDPEVSRIGLQLNNYCTAARDFLLEGLVAQAVGREAKGQARLALGQYLVRKAIAAKLPPRDKMPVRDYDDKGHLIEKEIDLPPEVHSYQRHLRHCDPDAIRADAKRLLAEVAKDYGDIPFVTRQRRKLERLLKEQNPSVDGSSLTPDDRKQIERVLSRRKTLAEVAAALLDEMENIAVGRPAPPIDGIGMDGQPLRLFDYRGKVVVLVFWGTWCGPCMAEVPHERAMADKYKGRPFALIGVDCDSDKDAALAVMRREGITWPNWNDGEPGEGPIVELYHARAFPTTFVLDHRGTIRHIGLLGTELDKAVDDLLDAVPKLGAPD
jgi:thiol-disulfide isomerase/thioredoxin